MKLHDPGTLKTFLARHRIQATKALGQHFLCDSGAVVAVSDAIAECVGVLEIGPGPGVLTGPISNRSRRLIALELDDHMIDALKESAPRAEVRRQDALTADLDAVLMELPEPRGVVSNMPYYITGPLLTKVAEVREKYSVAVLMMQREVAERIVAAPGDGDRGSLSVFLQSQFDITLVCHVPAVGFWPPPKVDSTVLSMVPKLLPVDSDRQKAYFKLIRLGFGQPRKTLANNLIAGFALTREHASKLVQSVGLTEKVRPHALSIEEWVRLCDEMP